MPRTARILSSTQTYHVVIRGADRQLLFEDTSDYKKYLEILQYYKENCNFELYAYCLMSNHVHLLIHTPSCALASVFHHINTRYAVWFNMKYQRTGHLQQERYFSEPVNDMNYLFTVLRYIHQNPCKAGLEATPGHSYPWSSFYEYKKGTSILVNTEYIFNLLGGKDNFLKLHEMKDESDCLDIDKTKRRIPDDVAKEIIFTECHCANVTEFQNLSLLERNKSILTLYKKGISIRQLNRLTGIPKGVIDRIVTKGQVP